jgi:hypothetical protein
MNHIETEIAEDILHSYSKKKWTYQTLRNGFFKERIVTSGEKVK